MSRIIVQICFDYSRGGKEAQVILKKNAQNLFLGIVTSWKFVSKFRDIFPKIWVKPLCNSKDSVFTDKFHDRHCYNSI